MIRALLLDFYGTLVAEDDPIIADIRAAVLATATRECTTREIGTHWWAGFQARMAGDFAPQRDIAVASLADTLAHFGSDADPEALCAPQFAFWRRPDLFRDTRAFLAALDIPVCIVSNIDRADVLAAIAAHDLPLERLVTSEDVRAYKPAAAPFRAALDLLGRAVDEVLHVGDSLSADVGGATALGIPVVWLNRAGRPVPEDFAGRTAVSSLAEVTALLRR